MVLGVNLGAPNLDIMLPGKATLTVHPLPFSGVKTAVGLDVSSTNAPMDVPFCADAGGLCTPERRFRFYSSVS